LSKDELPQAVVVQSGKVPGDVPGAQRDQNSGAPRQKHKRRLSNYLLDKKLQLRYVLVVTILSAIISGTLGTLIYQQMHLASQDVAQNLKALEDPADEDDDFQKQISDDMERRDSELMYEMAAVGIGMVIILSAYLVIMTHKVAGPLYKVSYYFDKMAAGKMGVVTPLRRGDMLTDFYDGFRDMHNAVRGRLQKDNAAMGKLVEACQGAGIEGDLAKAIQSMATHVEDRKKALA
jgi:nitrogen fixation/metabolism regulation signal transduction histidine kinase